MKFIGVSKVRVTNPSRKPSSGSGSGQGGNVHASAGQGAEGKERGQGEQRREARHAGGV